MCCSLCLIGKEKGGLFYVATKKPEGKIIEIGYEKDNIFITYEYDRNNLICKCEKVFHKSCLESHFLNFGVMPCCYVLKEKAVHLGFGGFVFLSSLVISIYLFVYSKKMLRINKKYNNKCN